MTSSVDVFIPNYNYSRFLRRTIDSVLAQDGVDLRVLVVDNASTDDSVAVVEDAIADDPRVHLLVHQENEGLIASLNDGLAWADAEYTVSLSADDMLAPGWLAGAVKALDANPEATFAFGPARLFSDETPGARVERRRTVVVHEGRDFIAATCESGLNRIRAPEGVFRTSAQRAVGLFTPSLPYSSDMGMWLRLASRGEVLEVRGPVAAFYRMHGGNMSTGDHLQALSDLEYPLAAIEDWYEREGVRVPDAEEMVLAAKRRLARNALRRAPLAYLRQPSRANGRMFEALLTFALENDPALQPRVDRLRKIAAGRGVALARDVALPLTLGAIKTRRKILAARISRGLISG